MDHGNNQTRSAIPQAAWCQLNRGRIRRLLGSQAELNKIVPFGFSLQRQKMVFFCHQNSIILLCWRLRSCNAMEELFNGQLSFADIDAEKFLHVRRAHADRRVNAMDRLTDDVINELIQLCLPHYHIKAGETVQQGRPYTRLETMVRVHLLNVKRQLEHAKASVRCSIEWCFLWLKRIYGYAKVRYRGLAKNHSRALTLFALYNCNRLRKWCAPPRLPC